MNAGKVTLVGAGPGDPDLLTIKAVKAIAAADVLLVDDLVGPDILAFANAQARVIHVGKRGGCKSTSQEFIERLMASEAQAGRHVVRLKGGDPYLFGRGGEERAHLRAQGIEVDVVPGISSGLAAPAALGIPLTHRQHSQGVIFVTGHGKDAAAEPNWQALAQTGLTLVIYMGIARCAAIRQALLDGGLDGATPAALVQSASRNDQRRVLTTVDAMPEAIRAGRIASPAIIVIGDVVRCADEWLDAQAPVAATGQRRAGT